MSKSPLWAALRARRDVLVPLGLIAAILFAYAPALRGGFVWDDDVNVTTNAAMLGLRGLRRIWTDVTTAPQYYPLTHTSFWLQVQATGFAPLPFHLVNVALHITTALLFRAILRRLSVPGATLAAFLFALHPLNVESVAWITERKNVLSGALGLGAALVYVIRDELAPGRRRTAFTALSFGLFVLALLAKTTMAMLPLALAAVLLGLRGRSPRALLSLAPWFVAAALAGLGTAFLERTRVGASGADFAWSVPFRVALATRAFVFYLTKLVWPVDLAFFYARWDIDPGSALAWVPLAVVVALFAAAFAARARVGKGPLVALLVYAAFILPALGFFNVYSMRYAYVQDHFAYLASLPVVALVAAGVTQVGAAYPEARGVFSLGVLALFTAQSVHESAAFRDYDTLFRRALEDNPDAWVASYDLGQRALDSGRADEAIVLFRRALHARPTEPAILGSLGTTLAGRGQLREGVELLTEAARLDPERAEAHMNLAVALDLAGRGSLAVAEYRAALRVRPDWALAERQLAWLLATTDEATLRDGPAAVELATRACARGTEPAAACEDTIAAAYAAAGDFAAASAHETRAVELVIQLHGGLGARRDYDAHARLYAEHRPLVIAPRSQRR